MNLVNNWSDSREWKRSIQRERLCVEATESICRLMKQADVNRKELATRLGRSQAFVTKVLRGDNNFTLSTLADIFLELNRSVHFIVGPLTDVPRITCADEKYFVLLDDEWMGEAVENPQYALAA